MYCTLLPLSADCWESFLNFKVTFPAGLYLTDGFNNTGKFQPLTGMLPSPWMREYLVALASAKLLLAPVMSFPETFVTLVLK